MIVCGFYVRYYLLFKEGGWHLKEGGWAIALMIGWVMCDVIDVMHGLQ